ncbi:Putative cytochrome c-type biogenesis protein, cycH [Oceaniovalibus guishaninsula JLT2003]|uniref:Putative cytochrome c-type biogenesis protein, cycH n=1 Tax=Oceaniovalibus guishaninsula JLT2003 TaxID=1231392 RepID=K2HEK3_9RHOB|nr:c-type cytochrome biogenesis protein CcmI [Oceaniovalibus guishaninsula]EKE44967.1 Putative cytochrome c-type biogenesis protein, cycH [Oceaniovalibus guishaninsula JLT2003]
MIFWAIALGLAGLAAASVALTLVRGRADADAATDIAIYRDQLAEVERDLARGVLTEDEAGRIRIEVQRRLLDADRAPRDAMRDAPAGLTGAAATLVIVACIGGGVGIYLWQGAPGYADMPVALRQQLAEEARATRPSQAEAEAQAPAAPPSADPTMEPLIARLRAALKDRPDDLEGYRLLARNEAGIGNYRAAIDAKQRVLDIRGADATPDERAELGEYMVAATGGYVSPEAEAVFDAVLAQQPGNGTALYYKGLAQAQTGRPDLTFAIWRDLLADSPSSAPWVPVIRAQLPQIAASAGLSYALPPDDAQGGPVPQAPEGMSAEDQAAMIEQMVSGLAQRLATEGGPASDWARLITAYGVLGRQQEAAAIWAEAQQVFAPSPDDLAVIRDAARNAGVAG